MSPSPPVLGIIQAGGAGGRPDVLTRERAKPAVAFAGSYRLIDFPLSSLSGSAIPDVWVSVAYLASSLDRHLAQGRPWDLDRTRGGLALLGRECGSPPGPRSRPVHGWSRARSPTDPAVHRDPVSVAD